MENNAVDLRGTPEWDRLRSEIYIRDRGICWICNKFVLLSEYDLGHLIDFCRGGKATYENLAVMHGYCNDIKPEHSTLEEAMKWKLVPSYMIIPNHTIPLNNVGNPIEYPIAKKPTFHINPDEKERIDNSIIEYFKSNPNLLNPESNTERITATRKLAFELKVPTDYIREIITNQGIWKGSNVINYKNDIYLYVKDHLKELVDKYNACTIPEWNRPQYLGITGYMMRIMFYLTGNTKLVNADDLKSIEKRVKELNIPITYMPIQRLNKRSLKNSQNISQPT